MVKVELLGVDYRPEGKAVYKEEGSQYTIYGEAAPHTLEPTFEVKLRISENNDERFQVTLSVFPAVGMDAAVRSAQDQLAGFASELLEAARLPFGGVNPPA